MGDPFDRSVSGYTELSVWPEEAGYPEEILGIWLYRDGGTVGITIKGKRDKCIEFFFDRYLGRLCYGEYETKSDAAFIKKGSKLEKEVYSYLENARKKLTSEHFRISDIELFNERFEKAKIYSGV